MFRSEVFGRKRLALGAAALVASGALLLPALGLTSSAAQSPAGETTSVAISQEAEGDGEETKAHGRCERDKGGEPEA